MWRIILTATLFVILIPYTWLRVVRPERSEISETLYQGITYERLLFDDPLAIVHVVEIDLNAPGIGFLVTSPTQNNEFLSQTTGNFLQATNLQVAINGSFYNETRDPNVLDPIGLVVSNGEVVKNGRFSWPTLCISSTNTATIHSSETCPADTQHAIAGNVRLVQDGQAINPRSMRFPGRSNAFWQQPRTAVALNQSGDTLWLVVVDGRQPNYSEGLTLEQLAQFLVTLGAYEALNLDGGGSSTLVSESWMGVKTLNSPIHNGIPTRQRPIPTHLGVYANP